MLSFSQKRRIRFFFVRGRRTGGAPFSRRSALKYNDIYTETPAHADTLANLGPLAPLAGKWYGEDGVDTHPEAEAPSRSPITKRGPSK